MQTLQSYALGNYTIYQSYPSPTKTLMNSKQDDKILAFARLLAVAFGMFVGAVFIGPKVQELRKEEDRIEEVYRKLSEEDEDELLQTACPDLPSFQLACMTDEHKEQVVKQELRELILN